MDRSLQTKAYVNVRLKTLDGWASLGNCYFEMTSSKVKITADTPDEDVQILFDYDDIRAEITSSGEKRILSIIWSAKGNEEHVIEIRGDPSQIDELMRAIIPPDSSTSTGKQK